MKKFSWLAVLAMAMVLTMGFVSCINEPDDEPKIYTVSFETNGGTAVDAQKIKSGKTVSKPVDPTKNATETKTFTFEGWYLDSELTEIFDFATKITKNIMLYAKWTENPIPATYTVKHLKQNVNDDNYTEVEADRETKNGNVGEQTIAGAKTYEGFTAQEFSQKTISASGTVIEIKYNRSNINYTVKHLQQNADNDGYTEVTADRQTLTGKTGATTSAQSKIYEHFTAQTVEQKTIKADGSTVIEIKYDRENVTLTFNTDGGTEIAAVSGRWGASYSKPTDPKKTGYTFQSWNPALPDTLSAITTKATWTANTNTAYTVEHYKQNLNDDEYTLVTGDTQNLTGTTNGPTAATAKTYDGFTAQSFSQATIAGNGSTVVKIYYNRDIINLTFKAGNGAWSDNTTADKVISEKYGATVSAPSLPAKTGCTVAWDKTIQTSFTTDETYTALFTPIEYTISYSGLPSNIENLNTTTYTVESNDFGIKSIRNGSTIYLWFDAETGGNKVSVIEKGSMGDKSLYARAFDITYFDLKKGSDINEIFSDSENLNASTATSFRASASSPANATFYLDSAETSVPVWYDEESKTIYYYLPEGGILRLNENSSYMFQFMRKLTYIETSDFDTSTVKNMGNMFCGTNSLISLDVSMFDTSKVESMDNTFKECEKLTSLDISNFNTSKLKYMNGMFFLCCKLVTLDFSNFDINNVIGIEDVFGYCSNLTTIFVAADADWESSENLDYNDVMFEQCNNLVGGAGTEYDAEKIDKTYARVDGGTTSPGYFTVKN
ncbi:MAG: InlB B-repeat-containing protein [Treponema sp.]|nr:InlB B-repeat-containing protein [Treponema sp.]